jgi:hypothetical protein
MCLEKMLSDDRAFHVQVSISCTERGRLMADVWTSHSELTSKILADIRSNDEAHIAMANALHRKHTVLDDARVRLQQRCAEYEAENCMLKARVAELENVMQGAQEAAWGTVSDTCN